MKDITRIHIAKVPYNVELAAKKKLEAYIAEIEAYSNDAELLRDIEIRITELLLERSVQQEDVITSADVEAICEQLGKPKEFMADETASEIDSELLAEDNTRKLYRNVDTALVGGMLSGVATFFRVDVLWLRLGFILLSVPSFGLSIFIYFLLWLVIPPARSAAQKLQLAGRAVTLASIRELNESGSNVNIQRRAEIQKRIVTAIIGTGSILGALISIGALAAVTYELTHTYDLGSYNVFEEYKLSIILAFAAGILLTILFTLAAFASFTQKFNKRIWISGIVIIVLGLSSFAGAAITSAFQNDAAYRDALRNTVETPISVPENFKSAKTLRIDAPELTSVTYVVDSTATSVKQRALRGSPIAKIAVENNIISVKLAESTHINRSAENTVTMYGPQLDTIVVNGGYVSYSSVKQASLKLELYNSSSLRLIDSRIDSLQAKTDGSAQLLADEATVVAAKVAVYGKSSVALGNIKSLDVTSSDVCASNETAQLSVENIISTSYIHNGIESARYGDTPCFSITFNKEHSRDGYQD